jgi:hypothetical protein
LTGFHFGFEFVDLSSQSCEKVQTALDRHDTDRDVENFVNEYGTGNQIIQPPNFVQNTELLDPELPGPSTIRQAEFIRISQRPAPVYLAQGTDSHQASPDTIQQPSPAQINGHDGVAMHNGSNHTSRPHYSNPPPQSNPPTQPPPPIPNNTQAVPATVIPTGNSNSASSRTNRQSAPLPDVPPGGSSRGIKTSQTPPPPLPQQPSGNTILFYGQ